MCRSLLSFSSSSSCFVCSSSSSVRVLSQMGGWKDHRLRKGVNKIILDGRDELQASLI